MNLRCDPLPTDVPIWPLCLAIVRCRRSGHWPRAPGRFALPPTTGSDEAATFPAGAAPGSAALDGGGGDRPPEAAAASASRPSGLREAPPPPLVRSTAPDAPLAWSVEAGWSLGGAPDQATLDFFALYKPLLDRAPGSGPWVIAQLGQSLDGFVATHRGHSCFVTGPQSLVHLHRLRALCDAVIVGAGTVAADDPRLTTRHVAGDHPVRVVLDPRHDLDGAARVFSDKEAPTWRLCDGDAACGPALPAGGEEVIPVPGLLDAGGALDAGAVVAALQLRGLALLFVEGGGITVSRFLAQGCLDRLHLAIAPVLIGAGRRGLQVSAADTMADCLRPAARLLRLGDDVLWDIDLRHPAPPVRASP